MFKLFLFTFLSINTAKADTIKVAVIDTGVDFKIAKNLCLTGHKDFTGYGLEDVSGHGSNVSGIIDDRAGKAQYCQIIIKYFHSMFSDIRNLETSEKAFEYVNTLDVDIVNFSSTGPVYSSKEKKYIKKLLDKNVKVVVPSGNKYINLDLNCSVFPACYDNRLIVVGRLIGLFGFGKIVDHYEPGYRVPGNGVVLTGTSQSTASITGKLIKEMWYNRKGKK